TPVASSTRRVASESSGPTPSPGINVTRWLMTSLPVRFRPIVSIRAALVPDHLVPGGARPGPPGADHRGEAPAVRSAHRAPNGYPNVKILPIGAAMTDKGLEEVVAASTRLSDVDGRAGRLWYVGYDIHELAARSTFEEVVYLLHNLRLPTEAELEELNERLVGEREVSRFLAELMPTLAQQTSPMSMLRTSVSAAPAYDPDGWDDSPEANERKAMRLIAKTPTLIAMYHRMRTGQEVVPPNAKLPHATTLVLYADHTMNASTFTARVIASTLADMFSAITGAIAALKGPLHGGA